MTWFSKKQESQSQGAKSERYDKKPLLILLENYVLDCLGQLSPEKTLKMTAVVQRVYGGGEDWKATLRSTLHLEESLDDNVRRLWIRNQEIAAQANEHLPPEDFARMIVDQNFAELVR
jgi:hypothetical protein